MKITLDYIKKNLDSFIFIFNDNEKDSFVHEEEVFKVIHELENTEGKTTTIEKVAFLNEYHLIVDESVLCLMYLKN